MQKKLRRPSELKLSYDSRGALLEHEEMQTRCTCCNLGNAIVIWHSFYFVLKRLNPIWGTLIWHNCASTFFSSDKRYISTANLRYVTACLLRITVLCIRCSLGLIDIFLTFWLPLFFATKSPSLLRVHERFSNSSRKSWFSFRFPVPGYNKYFD